jgi:deazaflavin-dependent oxidoreductase (nitroreductase family)
VATTPGGPRPRNLSLWFDRTVGRKLYPWHVRVYRLTRGAVGHRSAMGPMLLLTTTGRKSGQPRTTPLLYLPDGENFFVMGSNGARDADPQWLRNLEADPRATVQARRRVTPVTARVLRGDDRAAVWGRLTEFYAGWARYQQVTEREIPAVHLVVER